MDLKRLSKWWAVRSLAVGAVSTTLDLLTGGLVLWLGGPTRAAAMLGNAVGTTWTYFANRHLAFKDHRASFVDSAWKFVLMNVVLGIVHGQVVVWFRDDAGIPYVVAKMMADLLVVTGPQLLLMRYVIFPKQASPPEHPPS